MPRSYEIHPAIGIARVGSSISQDINGVFDGYFLGPEPGLAPPATYRDANGKLKRQAARFRLFEVDRDATGAITGATELTGQAGVTVTWTVTLANSKSAAPNFLAPGRRNGASGNATTDKDLIIGPDTKVFAGPNQAAARFNGAFRTVPVNLGQAWTDSDGRLLVTGGMGKSRTVKTPGVETIGDPGSFADNDDWYDDVSDGSIQAAVTLGNGTAIPISQVKAAWIIVGPFDFAPPIKNFVSLYDAVYQASSGKMPAAVSFTAHVHPILSRAVGYAWVNKRARLGHGGAGPGNFSMRWVTLAAAGTPATLRQTVMDRLRDPAMLPGSTPSSMPRLHDETNTSDVLPPTTVQWEILKQWVSGNFNNDWDATLVDPDAIEQRRITLLGETLPESLTRTTLEACSGGAFFPGIEVGRIVQRSTIYSEPLRINKDAVRPGELTQGNALPWQADFYACAYDAHDKIAWWPAQRPDEVFPEATPTVQKAWDDGINSDQEMVEKWDQTGVVRQVPTAGGIQYLETERILGHA